MKASHRKMLVELLSLPTSPLNEHYVIEYVRQWASNRPDVRLTCDVFGNLRLELRCGRGRSKRPLVFSAHMDHPGFEAQRMVRGYRVHTSRVRAVWRGGVEPAYFAGARVRFFSENRWVRGAIASVTTTRGDRGQRRVESATIDVSQDVAPGAIGMWNLPDPVIRGSRIHARSCDDLAGLAAVLAALDNLRQKRRSIDVFAIFTRAEEIGFGGAIACSKSGLVPNGARIVSVECSSEIPGVRMGDGPVLRVGDARTIFTPALTAFCGRVAGDLAATNRRFTFQRKLMDAGTCESAAFCAYGFEATGLCLALGNYHNMNRKRGRITAEYIDLGDFEKLIQWFVALATTKRRYIAGDPELLAMLDRLGCELSPQLRRTVDRV